MLCFLLEQGCGMGEVPFYSPGLCLVLPPHELLFPAPYICFDVRVSNFILLWKIQVFHNGKWFLPLKESFSEHRPRHSTFLVFQAILCKLVQTPSLYDLLLPALELFSVRGRRGKMCLLCGDLLWLLLTTLLSVKSCPGTAAQ